MTIPEVEMGKMTEVYALKVRSVEYERRYKLRQYYSVGNHPWAGAGFSSRVEADNYLEDYNETLKPRRQ